ncbi:MAG: SLBB domain-containing protein [Candidatus Schekmanbacteria bacterium]|nr:SLBB domain-containing protein [Candidatus Schekmanbacteria bacterium]
MIKIKIFILVLGMVLALYTNNACAGDYLLGAEDVLNISVWETPALDSQVTILPDGKITFPLAGEIKAAGLTPAQLKDVIGERLKTYIKDPIVTVLVSDIKSLKVYMLGEIKKPGAYLIKKKTTLLELLTEAGGVTENADLHRAYLLRNNKKLEIDFHKLLEETDISQNIEVQAGDNIFVPHNFSKRITVLGEIKTPQIISYKEGLTVLDVILMVGGFTDRADKSDVLVIRRKADKEEKIELNINKVIKEGDLGQNFTLKPGDTVIVGESWL